MRLRAAWASALSVLSTLMLLGCGSGEYRLTVRFPAGTELAVGARVRLDGAEVGTVKELRGAEDGRVLALCVIPEPSVAAKALREGVSAVLRSDGDIDLDALGVEPEASPLPSGSTIEGRAPSEGLVSRYATWPTLVALLIGAIVLVLAFGFFKFFFRLGVVVVSLLLSGGAATILHPVAEPWVEGLYAAIDRAQGGAAAPGRAGTAGGAKPSTIAPATRADTGGSPTAPSAPGGRGVERLIRRVARPSPKLVAFLGTWLAAFVVIQVLLGVALRATGRRK